MDTFWSSFANGARIGAEFAIIDSFNRALYGNTLNVAGRILACLGRDASIDDLLNAIEWQIRADACRNVELDKIRFVINNTGFLVASADDFSHLDRGNGEASFISVWNELKPVFKELLKRDVQLFNALLLALSISDYIKP